MNELVAAEELGDVTFDGLPVKVKVDVFGETEDKQELDKEVVSEEVIGIAAGDRETGEAVSG